MMFDRNKRSEKKDSAEGPVSKESAKCRDVLKGLWKEADRQKREKLDNLHKICEKFIITADGFKMEMNKMSFEKCPIRFETYRNIYKMVKHMTARVNKIDQKRKKYINNEEWIGKSLEEIGRCNDLLKEMLEIARKSEDNRENKLIECVEKHVNNKSLLQRLLKRLSQSAWCCLSHREGSTSGEGSDHQPESLMGLDVVKSLWEDVEKGNIQRKEITDAMMVQMLTHKLEMLDSYHNIKQSSGIEDYKGQKEYKKELASKEKNFKEKLKEWGIKEENPYYPYSYSEEDQKQLETRLKQLENECCSPQDGSALPRIEVGQVSSQKSGADPLVNPGQKRSDEISLETFSQDIKQIRGLRLGDYELTKVLGEGCFGKVFLGIHKPSGEKVAIKVPMDERDLKKFFEEIKKQASFNHPNIVPILGYGRQGKVPFLVMELMSGGTLAERAYEYLKEGRCMPLEQVAKYMKEAARGLAEMHAKGWAHGDIKSDNFFLRANGEVAVGDFGSASKMSNSVLGSHEIGIPAAEYKATTASNTCRASDESPHSAVEEAHDNASDRKELHHSANQTPGSSSLEQITYNPPLDPYYVDMRALMLTYYKLWPAGYLRGTSDKMMLSHASEKRSRETLC